MTRASELKDLLTFYREEYVGLEKQQRKICQARAKIDPILPGSDMRFLYAGQVEMRALFRVWMRDQKELSPKTLILWKGKEFQMVSPPMAIEQQWIYFIMEPVGSC